MSDKCSKLNAYVVELEHELKKIDAFKHQLPICNLLLIKAIEKLNEEQIAGCKKKEISQGNVEWLQAEDNSGDMDMKNWMSSVTLSLKPEEEEGIMKEEKGNGGQILNFNKDMNKREFLQFKRNDNSLIGYSDINNYNWNGERKVNVDREMISECKSYTKKKQRRCWSPELHRLFIDALNQLGGPLRATPKYIRDIMQVEDLTNDEVKSHLQKTGEIRRTPSIVKVFKGTRTPKATKENPNPISDERAQKKIAEMEEVRSNEPDIFDTNLTKKVYGRQMHGTVIGMGSDVRTTQEDRRSGNNSQ
ncbi:transcription factor HHO3-like [Impatiens glandulifera]|uniref:transcription factor HHO3-like n=1 Tax=Impatiens glandulifera TaxID=253017 RepID=UPI001FB112B6|nr:transcription factor HHO3-like [Impatiens glandulifera]